jgi:mono/diheme cytochrome c family protein
MLLFIIAAYIGAVLARRAEWCVLRRSGCFCDHAREGVRLRGRPRGRITSVLVCVCLWLVTLWPSGVTSQGRPAAVGGRATRQAATCQPCHGPNGVAPEPLKQQSFAGRGTWKHGSRPQDIVKTITEGVPGTAMLPFKGRLQPDEIAALAALVRSFDKTLKPGAAGRGK